MRAASTGTRATVVLVQRAPHADGLRAEQPKFQLKALVLDRAPFTQARGELSVGFGVE